jgi:hypothetical protein
MSLRALPPEQQIDRSRWRRLRYVPLSILTVLAAVAALIGATQTHSHPANAPDGTRPAPIVSPSASADAHALPEICRQPIPAPTQEPWLGSADLRAASQQTWDDHAAELSKSYVAEQDGWYDWGDVQANNFSQAVGRRILSVDEAAAWHSYFASLRDKLAAQGIPLYIVVAPAKWDVYPQLLPDWAQAIRGSNSLDQLLALYPDLPLVDIRAPLRDASVANQTFSRTNSHWTDYGADVGWSAIAQCIAASDTTLSSLTVPQTTGVAISAERNEFTPFGVGTGPADWTTPIYASPLKKVSLTDDTGKTTVVDGSANTDLLTLPAKTVTAGALTASSTLLVRDSFGNALSVPVQQTFATTWQVRHNLDGAPATQPDIAALASKYKPTVVILEIAERHLNFPPGL